HGSPAEDQDFVLGVQAGKATRRVQGVQQVIFVSLQRDDRARAAFRLSQSQTTCTLAATACAAAGTDVSGFLADYQNFVLPPSLQCDDDAVFAFRQDLAFHRISTA